MKRLLYFLVLAIAGVFPAYSQTYYFVDSENGNDNNSGTPGNKPWKTIAKVNEQTFSAGDRVMFRRGRVWVGEQLKVHNVPGTDPSPVTYGAFPQTEEPLPVITTITVHQHTWTNEGGNIWKAVNPPAYHPERMLVDDTELLRANKKEELDGVNFFWLYDGESNADLYLYSLTDPSAKEISYSNGLAPVSIENSSGIVFTNLNIQGGWTCAHVKNTCSYIHFIGVTIGKYARNGVYITSDTGPGADHVHIKNSTFDAVFDFDYSMAGVYDGSARRGSADAVFIAQIKNCEIDSNTFKNWGHASIHINGNPGSEDSVKTSHMTIHDNLLSSPDISSGGGLVVSDAFSVEVYNNRILNTSAPSQLSGYNNHIHHNIFDGTKASPFTLNAGIEVNSNAHTEVKSNVYEHNLILNSAGPGILISTAGKNAILSNTFRNNILYNCGTASATKGLGIKINNNTDKCEITKNVFTNNLVYNETVINTIDFQGTQTTIIGFNELTGTAEHQIENNILAKPLFVDEENGDYHLNQGSACVNMGITPKAEIDYEGNTIPFAATKPDIGLYESEYTTSVKSLFMPGDILVYPNPAKSIINISGPHGFVPERISLFNIKNEEVPINQIKRGFLDVSPVPTGMYFLQILSAGEMYTKRVVKIE
ncbi:MAG: right-handed parallel beta-helix repeat-containing protein [Fibrobacteria bacterium]|nr:right-handed parallel beta-helix repeat-containing protein [Fibrobacteria bacterium]